MNETMKENGLVPSRLAFGIIPSFPILSTDFSNRKKRMEAITSAQAEMNSIEKSTATFEQLTLLTSRA